MSKLFFGSVVRLFSEVLGEEQYGKIAGFLLCLPLDSSEYMVCFKENDCFGKMCFGRECVVPEKTRLSYMMKEGPRSINVNSNIIRAYNNGSNIEKCIKRLRDLFWVYISDVGRNGIILGLRDLIESDPTIAPSTREMLLELSGSTDFDDSLLFIFSAIQYAMEAGGKPPTTLKVFKGLFPHALIDNYVDETARVYRVRNLIDKNGILVLYGSGGMGKTRLARQYLHASIKEKTYDSFCWVDASTPDSIVASYAEFLNRNAVATDSLTDEQIIKEFSDFITPYTNWLLVYDNLSYETDDERDRFLNCLPVFLDRGHVLITSKTNRPLEQTKRLKIAQFTEAEAIHFLILNTENPDIEGAKRLAIRLGCFPLALAYAAAFIRETPTYTYDKYIDRLNCDGMRVLDVQDSGVDHKYVRDTYNTSINKIIKETQTEDERNALNYLLKMCAFSASQGLFVDLLPRLGQAYHEDGPITKTLQIDNMRNAILRRISRYSIIDYDSATNSLIMHDMLKQVIREESYAKNEWSEEYYASINRHIRYDYSLAFHALKQQLLGNKLYAVYEILNKTYSVDLWQKLELIQMVSEDLYYAEYIDLYINQSINSNSVLMIYRQRQLAAQIDAARARISVMIDDEPLESIYPVLKKLSVLFIEALNKKLRIGDKILFTIQTYTDRIVNATTEERVYYYHYSMDLFHIYLDGAVKDVVYGEEPFGIPPGQGGEWHTIPRRAVLAYSDLELIISAICKYLQTIKGVVSAEKYPDVVAQIIGEYISAVYRIEREYEVIGHESIEEFIQNERNLRLSAQKHLHDAVHTVGPFESSSTYQRWKERIATHVIPEAREFLFNCLDESDRLL